EETAAVEIEDHQRRYLVAVDAGNHHIPHQRRASGDKARAERPDTDPRAAGQLEVLGNAAVEIEAGAEIVGIDRLEGVAEFVESFGVERGGGQLRLPPIARRDVGPTRPDFQFALVRDQLRFITGYRESHMAGAA